MPASSGISGSGIDMFYYRTVFCGKVAVGAATGIRYELFTHIQTLGYEEMDTVGTSTLITRMTSDINQVQNGINLVLRLFRGLHLSYLVR